MVILHIAQVMFCIANVTDWLLCFCTETVASAWAVCINKDAANKLNVKHTVLIVIIILLNP
jgi:hypothetical protein